MTTTERLPRQSNEIVELLQRLGTFQTAQEIHLSLKSNGSTVGLATVYRHLASLAQSGQVDCIVRENGETKYRSCSPEHHHHLLCRVCGKTVEVAAPAIETWCAGTAKAHGFTNVSHTIEVVGTCADCS